MYFIYIYIYTLICKRVEYNIKKEQKESETVKKGDFELIFEFFIFLKLLFLK